MLVVDRRGGTGEVVDPVDLVLERIDHIVPDKLEVGVFEEMGDVALGAGEKIVDAQYVVAIGE